MTTDDDALALGQKLVQVVDVGRKVSTYKLATLVALLDVCLGSDDLAPDAPLQVHLDDLADRVVDLYWPQVRPFSADGTMLRQHPGGGGVILDLVGRLRDHAHRRKVASAARLAELGDPLLRRTRRRVAVQLAAMPLTHLQTLPTGTVPFLYDEPWLHKKVTGATVDAHGSAITLLPGVAWHLARLSGLLRPMLLAAWEAKVVRLNSDLREQDVSGFLFGAERAALAHAAADLADLQDGRCFYCEAPLRKAAVHVDHVLPWSRVPLDGTANLVATDVRCNLDKRDALPVPAHLERALARDDADLRAVAAGSLPLLRDRTRSAGRALYAATPSGTPLWLATGVYELNRS